MSRYVQVDEVDTVESSSSTALVAIVVALLAIVIIAMVWWQPWAAPVSSPSSTTIIHDSTTKQPDNRPIIVNPPAANPGDTKIDIHNSTSSDTKKDSNDATNTNGADNNSN